MRKSMRKVIPALALLLVSAIILSSASYAWFTMSRQVTAQGMNVTVTAPNNLLIDAAAGTTWAEIETLDAGTGVELVPASTVNGTNFFFLDNSPANVAGTLIDDKSVLTAETPAPTAVSPANKSYYDFKYQIKTEGGVDVPVTLISTALDVTDDTTKPVRIAILTGAAANPTTVAGMFNVGGGTHFTPGEAINAAKAAGAAATKAAVTYKTAAAVTDPATDAATLFTAPASGAPVYVTIRVWFEGEDDKCTAAIAAKAEFDLTAVFAANQ